MIVRFQSCDQPNFPKKKKNSDSLPTPFSRVFLSLILCFVYILNWLWHQYQPSKRPPKHQLFKMSAVRCKIVVTSKKIEAALELLIYLFDLFFPFFLFCLNWPIHFHERGRWAFYGFGLTSIMIKQFGWYYYVFFFSLICLILSCFHLFHSMLPYPTLC